MSEFLESRDDAKFTYEIVLIPPLPCPVVMLAGCWKIWHFNVTLWQ